MACVLIAAALIVTRLRSNDPKASHGTAAAPRADAGDADDAPRVPAPAAAATVVRLSPQGQEQGGIATAEPKRTTFRQTVTGYGVVLATDRLTALYNEALTQATQLKAAEAKAAASHTANGRAQDLLKVFPTNKAQAEAASATAAADAIAVEAVRTQSITLRNTAVDQWGPVLGDAVAARSALIDDLVLHRTCLIQLSLGRGGPAEPPREVVFTSDDGTKVTGRFVAGAAQVDPRIQGIGYLYATPAAPGLLPGRSLVAEVAAGHNAPGIDVPASAVVWQAGKPWIYLRTAANLFEREAIDDASPTPDGGYVLPAKRVPGDRTIVVAGAQVLLSQELKAQIPSDEDDN